MSRPRTALIRRGCWACLLILTMLLVVAGAIDPTAPAAAEDVARLAAACDTLNPFLATTRFLPARPVTESAQLPAVVAFRDMLVDSPDAQIVLASQAAVGPTYGLAYDAPRQHLFAAAYYKVGTRFGPRGPGAIYRIDLTTGKTRNWVTLPAGLDRHVERPGNLAPEEYVGRSSLGDIELDETGTLLFAANLYSGRIHRVTVPGGEDLGSFANGAAVEAWAEDGQLLGLGYQSGWLYHGVTDLKGTSLGINAPVGYVYRSRPDGSEMHEVAAVPFTFPRPADPVPGARFDPVLADIEFTAEADLILGLRNVAVDKQSMPSAWPAGDVLSTTRLGDRWTVPPRPEFYDDQIGSLDETAQGALAVFWSAGAVVSSALLTDLSYGGAPAHASGAVWFSIDNGSQVRSEFLTAIDLASPSSGAGIGDVELLCAPHQPVDPAVRAGATRAAAEREAATRIAVSTVAAATWTALPPKLTAEAPTRAAIQTVGAAAPTPLPLTATTAAASHERIVASCDTDNPMLAVARFARARDEDGQRRNRGSLARAPALTVFNDTSPQELDRHMHLAYEPQLGAVFGLAYDWRRGHLYAGAYHKVYADTGPQGPGAIYQIDVTSGAVRPWAWVDAGPAFPASFWEPYPSTDLVTAVGRTGLGDLELDPKSDTLLVTNLYDRLIYRFSVPGGELLGAFPNGGAVEQWAADARPFGLGIRDGWLYHGVISSGEVGPGHWTWPGLSGHVFRSRPDGSNMMHVAAFPLDYDRHPRPSWRRWIDTEHGSDTVYTTGPMLTDVEFDDEGGMIIGLRDRESDGNSRFATAGTGDILPGRREGARWTIVTSPEHYEDDINLYEGAWGSLAALPGANTVVSSFVTPVLWFGGGAVWFDNVTGAAVRKEEVDHVAAGLPSFSNAAGLGDVESLCPPLAVPSPSTTPTATTTSTAAPTATATPRLARAATPLPKPIFLPLLLAEHCESSRVRADVALVIDTSSSMAGQKLSDAKAASASFVGLLDLNPDGDQVAVVRYDAEAELVHELSRDRQSVTDTIFVLGARQGTHIDTGLRVALDVLQSSRRIDDNTPVIVLLTDGIHNGVAGADLVAAAEVRNANVVLYTIGLGEDVDEEALIEMVGDPGRYFFAPDSRDLTRIYGEVAREIDCSAESYWGRR